jgi:septal ring factor EnvC (AmiA/AmiB activator)
MTFVGKILVGVIMACALLFLGISTVVFTTAVNWKAETAKQKDAVSKLQSKNNDLTAAVDAAKKDLDKAVGDHKTAVAQADTRIKGLEDDVKKEQAERAAAQSKLEVAQQSANTTLTLAEQRLSETTLLRDQKSAVEKQANEYKLQQTELNDKIRELERQTKTLDDDNKDLRDRVARYSTLLRKNGLSDDISVVKGLESPPPVKGEVKRIDARNSRVEITIGSDDGLVPGHELYLYRTKPRSEFLGRILIQSVDPDQAVGKVIGNTVSGKKIQEGDIVSSTIPRPRG